MQNSRRIISKKAAFAGVSGTIFQWYDFSLFGFFAPIIAKQFFPGTSTIISLMSTFGVFAVGFLLAPLGAVFFGHIGDRYGRKRVLSLSILLMTIPTTLIGFLPSYQSIGILAPILLTLFRLIQGFVASAEFAGSAIFLLEHAPEGRQCFYSSLTSSSYSIGMIIGSLTASLVTMHFMPEWAWRLPFILSLCAGLIISYLRTQVCETPIFDVQKCQKHYPMLRAFSENPRSVATTIGIAAFAGIISYGSYVYMVTYLHATAGLSLSTAIVLVSLALLIDAITEPFIAMLADKIGKKVMMRVGSILMILLVTPIFMGLSSGSIALALSSIVTLTLLIAITFSPSNALMGLSFPSSQRCSGFGVSFNIGITLFGGTAPLVLAYLVHYHNRIIGPVSYYLFAILIGLVSLYFSREYSGNIRADLDANNKA